MRNRTNRRSAMLLAVTLVASGLAARAASNDAVPLSVSPDFASRLDLAAFRIAAVQEDGRVKTIDSLAREKLAYVNARAVRSVDPVLLMLDLMLAPEHYAGANIIDIHKPAFRNQLVQLLRSTVPPEQRTGVISDVELQRIQSPGPGENALVSPAFLDHPAVSNALMVLDRDLMRTSKEVSQLNGARAYSDGRTLEAMLRVVPRPGARDVDPWFSIDEVLTGRAPQGAMPAAFDASAPSAGLNPALAGSIAAAWSELGRAWRTQDAATANRALATLASNFAASAPTLYPSVARRAWEHWYYKHDKLTAAWLVYFFGLPFLLMAFVYRLRWARAVGLTLFVVGFGLQTFSIVLRWWLAGRIPNSNMFEAITASAWLGGAAAVALELFLRRWPVKNLPALAASTYGMLVLMAGRYLPIVLPGTISSDIGTVMPVLDRTVWLYIHTNMVIASYALIFFGSVTALLYLVLRGLVTYVPQLGLRAAWEGSTGAAAVRGGASSIIFGGGLGQDEGTGIARSLDGATMIFLELAFVTLWLGTILGAVWAYFSWGRPWGWDPKEVFALNTWIVFLVLVHVRLKVKDKAFWTAVLALVGCAVMLFNWIAVNFVVVGLHSYA